MKVTFVFATITAVATMAGAITSDDWTKATRATESVEDLFKSLKKDPSGNGGKEALLLNGMVVSYDKDGKIFDQKQASKEAVDEYIKAESQKPNLAAVPRPSHTPRRAPAEDSGLVERQILCDAYACDDPHDCQAAGCYGGCRQNIWGNYRCRA
ncbi:hypothetical protein F4820DRAFT_470597 [Hypoxylon rubiginosum]|uniref:Uncharacterized protein n=1 Tax=Hypoxylon rubiginosum TaxID=110542 RepID=A0ACB9YYF4_9PEZI|nr:hypothetical protein F4820DRAFT_470597 [Hypoxylon rubiginosum]